MNVDKNVQKTNHGTLLGLYIGPALTEHMDIPLKINMGITCDTSQHLSKGY